MASLARVHDEEQDSSRLGEGRGVEQVVIIATMRFRKSNDNYCILTQTTPLLYLQHQTHT
jgi:hypothetical protein